MQKRSILSIFLLIAVLVPTLVGCNASSRTFDGVTYTRTPAGVVTTYDYGSRFADPSGNTTRINMGTPANPYNATLTEQATSNSTSMLANRIRAVRPDTTTGMMELTEDNVRTRLGLDTSMFEEYYFLDSKNSLGDMIYVVKVKDEADKKVVRDAFNSRLFAINDAALATMPDRLSVSREGRIVENGRYMMLIIGNNQDSFIDNFYTLGDSNVNNTTSGMSNTNNLLSRNSTGSLIK